MEKYMKTLDNQLNHFKINLEANNSGITNIIEKSTNKYIIYFKYFLSLIDSL